MVDVTTIIAVIGAVVTAASAFCAATPTPDPNTTWGKIYSVIEFLGLLVGKAKQLGYVKDVPPAPPAS